MENIDNGREFSLAKAHPHTAAGAADSIGSGAGMRVVYGDCTLGLQGGNFHYIFNYGIKGLESLVKNGREWMYRGPLPTFWRALTDNDRGNGLHLRSGMWLAADQFIRYKGVKVIVDGQDLRQPDPRGNNRFTGQETAGEAEMVYTYETITVPSATVEVSYRVEAEGRILVRVCYHGREGLPELPVFGMRFVLPTLARGFTYEGLSGETYPDRMAGGLPGVYEVEGLPVTPYLVPQDCGVHMDSKWVRVHPSQSSSNVTKGPLAMPDAGKEDCLEIRMGRAPFAFSCLPYTAQELENATHQEELPLPRRTILCVLGAVRGLGGRDTWGAQPEPAFRLDAAGEIAYDFYIC